MPVKTKKAKTPVKELTGVQDLYHFLYEACNILRKFVEHESFKDYITPLLYYKRLCDVWDEEYEAASRRFSTTSVSATSGTRSMKPRLRSLAMTRNMRAFPNSIAS